MVIYCNFGTWLLKLWCTVRADVERTFTYRLNSMLWNMF